MEVRFNSSRDIGGFNRRRGDTMIGKPELSEETKRRANEVYRYLRTEARPVTKEELCSFLGWEYNSSSERRVRDLISIIAKRKPIIATSDQRGYKVPTIDDLEAVEHQWRELDSRISELAARREPLIKFAEKIKFAR